MNADQKLKEGDTVVFQTATFSESEFKMWEVNVQVVDVLRDNAYRIKPISGHGTRIAHISQLFY